MFDTSEKYFSLKLSDRERACFESGIKLGALYHILCGIPISKDEKTILSIEKGIAAAISCQPYVKSVKLNFNRNNIAGDKETEYDYDEITGKIIQAQLIVEFKQTRVTAKVEWIKELQYPLMYIEDISERK